MSEIKVNKITPRTACGTTQLGDSGDTITIPSGATITNLGTATGFGGTGVVSWDTASIKTTGFTAVTGTGYFCNTTGGAFTVTLPLSPSAGDVVGVSDYAKTFDTDNLTLGRNGSNIGGAAEDSILLTEGVAVTLVYVDGTKGWIVTDSGNQSDAPPPTYLTATGGCITTSGDYKMHTFLSPNTFTVCSVGNQPGTDEVDYLVIGSGAGGGQAVTASSAGCQGGGGGGAGGYRESNGTISGCYTIGLPANSGVAALPVSASPGAYPITVVGGGAGGTGSAGPLGTPGLAGGNSTFSTITSNGGGGGAKVDTAGIAGASGGGAGTGGAPVAGGAGNTPPVSPAPPQGNAGGGNYAPTHHAGGGGGASAVGSDGGPSGNGCGGAGATSSINATPTARGGGGGGGPHGSNRTQGAAGPGGGGASGVPGGGVGANGGCNTGGGGGGSSLLGGGLGPTQYAGGNGGSGVVIIRYKYQ